MPVQQEVRRACSTCACSHCNLSSVDCEDKDKGLRTTCTQGKRRTCALRDNSDQLKQSNFLLEQPDPARFTPMSMHAVVLAL